MFLLCRNISHFTIFILFYITGLYFLKAATFNQHVMIRKIKVMKEGMKDF